jgi:CheY-like chemotaxis protein
MLTSGARPQDARTLEALGVHAHLLKPAKQSEIYNAVIGSLSVGHPQSGHAVATVSPKVEPVSPRRHLRILLAEDNLVNQKLAIGVLEKLGHKVIVASNGQITLDKLKNDDFDLVLMDVQMPEMDGLTEIRKQETRSGEHIPIIAMTAHAMKGDRENCLDAGMDEYLSKPIRSKDLEDILVKFIPAGAEPRSSGEAGESGTASGNSASQQVCWKKALKNTAGDELLLRELLLTFQDDVPRLLKRLIAAVEENDRSNIRSLSHSIKGSLGFLETSDAQAYFQNLEDCAEEAERETVEQKFAECLDKLNTVMKEIDGRLQAAR